jgi:multidrug efflux pump subunit AcrB
MKHSPDSPVSSGGIIGWFTHNPVAANLLMGMVIVLGIMQMFSLRKEAFPSLEPDAITVSISYSSGSAQQAEEGLAIKIEEALESVSGIKTITSTATGSSAKVTIERQSGYNLDQLLADVKAKVDAISTFPADAKKPVIEKAERQEHSLWIQLYGNTDRHTLQQLGTELKSDLLASASISSVSESGWRDPMMVIEVDEGRLQAYGLSLTDVENAVNNGSSTSLTAVMQNENLYLQLMASQQAYRKADFARIPLLTTNSGKQLLLGDVADITDGWDTGTAVLSRFQGQSSIALQVITTGQDDISNTVKAARTVVEKWHADGRLPVGVELQTWYDRSVSINQRLQLLVSNAISGIVMVFILLALFLNLTVAFWVAMGLPFIFFGTLYFMGDNWTGLSLNEFTTFGFIMALGIVVDDAVVIGESVYTERSRYGDTLANTLRGTMRVAIPTLFGVFTTVAAFYALSNLEGNLGQLYSQFAAVVTICLLLSLVESKLILPSHLAHLNTHKKPGKNPLARGWGWAQHQCDHGLAWFTECLYKPVIEAALRYRYAVVIGFLGLFILVMGMPFTGAVRVSFFPEIPGDTVRAELTMRPDASWGQTHRILMQLEQQAYQLDQRLGGNGIAHVQVMAEANQSGKVTVELSASAPYDIDRFTRDWKTAAGLPEGTRTLRVQSRPDMVDALRIELRSSSDDVLEAAGQEMRRKLLAITAVSGIEDNLDPTMPQLNLQLNAQGQALGLTTADLGKQLLQGFSGQVVQRYQRNVDEIEVKVRYPEAARQNIADVLSSRIQITDSDGNSQLVPLSSVATVTQGFGRDSITRINGKRAVYLSADVDKERMSSTELVELLKKDVAPQLLKNYPGLDIHFAGEAEEQAETQHSMVQMFLLAMLIIYSLLAVPLKSWMQPVLIMTAIPFGVVGAILGHWLLGMPLSILSFNGIIALSGVVVNDSLLLVSRFNELHPDADHYNQAISKACRDRVRAVLLTSLTTFAGLMPLLFETESQAQFLIPAAVSLGYGIMFATVITLILIPSLLAIQHDLLDRFQALQQRVFRTDSDAVAISSGP